MGLTTSSPKQRRLTLEQIILAREPKPGDHFVKVCAKDFEDGDVSDLSYYDIINDKSSSIMMIDCVPTALGKRYPKYTGMVYDGENVKVVSGVLVVDKNDYLYICSGCKYHTRPQNKLLLSVKNDTPNGSNISSSASRGDIITDEETVIVEE